MISKLLKIYLKDRLIINATLSILQVVLTGLIYFILYSVLLKTLGTAKLGIWSLILSTTSIANLAYLGLASSLVKFIAMCSPKTDLIKINLLIGTGFFSISIFIAILCLLMYVVGYFLLPTVLINDELSEGMAILPWSLLSLWITGLAGVFLSALDGLHWSSMRSLVYIISSIFFLILGCLFVQLWGLKGMAYAQIMQAISTFCLAVFFVKKILKKFSFFLMRWDKIIFKQIFKYSAELHVIGVFQLLYDPISKFLLSKYGGLDFVGFYELAYRLVMQIRSLIVSANQVIVPMVSHLTKGEGEKQDTSYLKVLNIVILFAFTIFTILIVLAPYISFYWIGHYEKIFLFSMLVLTIGYFFNTIATPAYFSNMGIGDLKGNLLSQIVIALINVLLGVLLGYSLGGWGVILAWGISLVVGAFITGIYYHTKYNVVLDFKTKRNLYLSFFYSVITCFMGITVFVFGKEKVGVFSLMGITTVLLIIYIFYIFKNNSISKEIVGKKTWANLWK